MFTNVLSAVRALIVLSVLTGILYPLLVTGIAQLAFPWQANGSLVVRDARVIGSQVIGQPFSDPKYFWGRPSATAPYPYNASASAGSNLGATNPALTEVVTGRIKALRDADPGAIGPVPSDLVTASASGLDPHISVAAALFQATRVAKARGLRIEDVRDLIALHTETPALGLLGERRVNVLRLNLALDRLVPKG